jgi:hypothetical protein
MTPAKPYRLLLDRLVRFGAAAVILVAGTVVLGWTFRLDVLESGLPGLATMKINTACAFAVAGVALLSIHSSQPRARSD